MANQNGRRRQNHQHRPIRDLHVAAVLWLLLAASIPAGAFSIRTKLHVSQSPSILSSCRFPTNSNQCLHRGRYPMGHSRLSVATQRYQTATGVESASPLSDESSSFLSSLIAGGHRLRVWLLRRRPIQQLGLLLLFYFFHLKYIGQWQIVFPFQLIPNDGGYFLSLGMDSFTGFLSLIGIMWTRRFTEKEKSTPTPTWQVPIPKIWSLRPSPEELPWRFPLRNKSKIKLTAVLAFFLLFRGYLLNGMISLFLEEFLWECSALGFPLTTEMHRSLHVLTGHLSWAAIACCILHVILRPQPFFGGGLKEVPKKEKDEGSPSGATKKVIRKFRWFTSQWNTFWLGWVVAGFMISCWVFNFAEFINELVLPRAMLESGIEGSVVSELINPADSDWWSSFVGSIAPCASAPWFEEILYRGYLLPALACFLPFWPAVVMSGAIFSVTHMNWPGSIPLMALGWAWATLYAKCGNLLVTIMIHVMWNSRVFMNSWFGFF